MQRSAVRFASVNVALTGRAVTANGIAARALLVGVQTINTRRHYHNHHLHHRIDLGVEEDEIQEWDCKKAPDSASFVNADKMPVRSIEEMQHETLAVLSATHSASEDHGLRL
jgi:hypothetical protein